MSVVNPARLPHAKTKGSGQFVRMFAKPCSEATMSENADSQPARPGFVIPREWVAPIIVGAMLSGFGGPALNFLGAFNTDQTKSMNETASQLKESAKLLTDANKELIAAIKTFRTTAQDLSDDVAELGERVNEIDARTRRTERAEKAIKEAKQ